MGPFTAFDSGKGVSIMSETTRREFIQLVGSTHASTAFASTAHVNKTISSMPALASSDVSPDDLASLTLAEASSKIHNLSITPTQLTEACLKRIDSLNPKLDAYITVMRELALAQAKQLDAEQEAGKFRSPLHGIPLAIKDNMDTAGVRTTAGSAVYEDRVPTEDATVVSRLKAAGAVLMGKTNLQEFAMGEGESSYYGPARNPWALDRSTGGSSSGSGSAVSAGLCFGALGTDTAGSIREPASYCGIVGLKATYGLVPIRGIVPLVPSLDHCGPLARSVEDVALILDHLAGYDKLDITSVAHGPESYVAGMKQPISQFRLGTPIGYFDSLDPEVDKAPGEAIALLVKMTKGAKDVTLPSAADFSSGNLSAEEYAYHEDIIKHNSGRYMLSIRRRMEALAAAAPTSPAVNYVRTRWGLELLRRTIDDVFTDCDLIVLPTQRILPPLLNDLIERSLNPKPANPAIASNIGPFDAFGIPTISVPCGFSESGLPIGLMIAGPNFAEAKVLALAHAYEQATQWHTRKPSLTAGTPVPPALGYANTRPGH